MNWLQLLWNAYMRLPTRYYLWATSRPNPYWDWRKANLDRFRALEQEVRACEPLFWDAVVKSESRIRALWKVERWGFKWPLARYHLRIALAYAFGALWASWPVGVLLWWLGGHVKVIWVP